MLRPSFLLFFGSLLDQAATDGAKDKGYHGQFRMKLLLSTFVFSSLISVVSAQSTGSPCTPLGDTDWGLVELCGRVKQVRVYKSWFKKDEKSGRVIEGKRELEEQASYDRSGNQITFSSINKGPDGGEVLSPMKTFDSKNRMIEIRYTRPNGSFALWSKYAYDDKGNKVEEARYFPDGTLEWRARYVLDDRGNKIEEVLTVQAHPEHFTPKRYDVYVTTKRLFKYDGKNNQIEETHLYPNGSLYATWTRTFDAANRLLRELRIDKIGRPEELKLNTYDSRGNLLEETHYTNFCYNRDDSMCEGSLITDAGVFYYGTKTVYEYDGIGNWIKQMEYTIYESDGLKKFEPSTGMYRQIVYFK